MSFLSPNDTPVPMYGDITGCAKWCSSRAKRILVCGSRDFDKGAYTPDQVKTKLYELKAGYLKDTFITIVNGWGDGVDYTAAEWAEENHIPFYNFPANWTRYNKLAGPYRNQLMLDVGDPHIVVCFPGGKGTKDMRSRALAAHLEVIDIEFGN